MCQAQGSETVAGKSSARRSFTGEDGEKKRARQEPRREPSSGAKPPEGRQRVHPNTDQKTVRQARGSPAAFRRNADLGLREHGTERREQGAEGSEQAGPEAPSQAREASAGGRRLPSSAPPDTGRKTVAGDSARKRRKPREGRSQEGSGDARRPQGQAVREARNGDAPAAKRRAVKLREEKGTP